MSQPANYCFTEKNCPKCGKTFLVPEADDRKVTACPFCGNRHYDIGTGWILPPSGKDTGKDNKRP